MSSTATNAFGRTSARCSSRTAPTGCPTDETRRSSSASYDADQHSLANFFFSHATPAGDRDLRDVLDREGSDEDERQRAALDTATALRAAHANNVAHGDVDPAKLASRSLRLSLHRPWRPTLLAPQRRTPTPARSATLVVLLRPSPSRGII